MNTLRAAQQAWTNKRVYIHTQVISWKMRCVCVCVWPSDTDCRTSCTETLMFSKETITQQREDENQGQTGERKRQSMIIAVGHLTVCKLGLYFCRFVSYYPVSVNVLELFQVYADALKVGSSARAVWLNTSAAQLTSFWGNRASASASFVPQNCSHRTEIIWTKD